MFMGLCGRRRRIGRCFCRRRTTANSLLFTIGRLDFAGEFRPERSRTMAGRLVRIRAACNGLMGKQVITGVTPGLVPGTHVLLRRGEKGAGGRDKPGHDSEVVALAKPTNLD